MNRYQSETVYLSGWFTTPWPLAAEQDKLQALAVAPQASVSLPGTQNFFQARTGAENKFVPLTALDLQILAEGIVLDKELIAECRSGEI